MEQLHPLDTLSVNNIFSNINVVLFLKRSAWHISVIKPYRYQRRHAGLRHHNDDLYNLQLRLLRSTLCNGDSDISLTHIVIIGARYI